jgi:putative transposase
VIISAKQIAAAFKGTVSDRGVNKFLQEHGVLAIERRGRGGENFFDLDAILRILPRRRRNQLQRWRRKQASAAEKPVANPAGATPAKPIPGRPAAEFLRLPEWALGVAVARAELLAQLDHFRGIQEQFVDSYNMGQVEVSDATRGAVPTVSSGALKRWRKQKLGAGGSTAALAPLWGNRSGQGMLDLDGDQREVVLAMITRYGKHLRAPRVLEALRAKFPGSEIPSASTIRKFIRLWHEAHPSLSLAIHNPDKWKSKFRVKVADADSDITRLNQEWQIDGTPGDVLCVDGRHHILAIIDVYSRRALFHVAPSESSHAAIALICRAVTAWGVPEIIHGDNGSGFISDYSSRFIEDLGVSYIASPPFRPETKPFVESVIGVMAHELLAMLPGFAGHSVAQRQDLRARESFAARFGAPAQKVFEVKLTAAELQAKLDAWTIHYNSRPHSGLAGKSPNQVAAEYTGEVRRIADPSALALVAGEGLRRTLRAEGLSINGARFIATLDTIGDYVAHIGEEALTFPDPSGDFGRYFVFRDTPKGREFLCLVENEDRLGFDRSNLALVARQVQDCLIRQSRAELRRIKNRIKPETLVDTHLELAARNAPELASQATEVIHLTAALAAASAALDLAHGRVAPVEPHSPEVLAEGEQVLLRHARQAEARAARLSDDQLDLLWVKIRRTGEPLTDREQQHLDRYGNTCESWALSYEGSSTYRAMRRLERFDGEERAAS